MLEAQVSQKPVRTLALVGAPNSGKTTLYNWLTGSKFKTVNYPGATVEYAKGSVQPALGEGLIFIDTPGTYSLNAKSADEEITAKVLFEERDSEKIDGVIIVIDGVQIHRQLLLALQMKQVGFPFVVVVTMADVLKKEGLQLQMDFLQEKLGAEKVIVFDGLLGSGLREIVQAAQLLPVKSKSENKTWSSEQLEKLSSESLSLSEKVLVVKDQPAKSVSFENTFHKTQWLDRWLLHPVLGFVFFFLFMSFLFSSIYWFAQPFMDLIDEGFSGLASNLVERWPDSAGVDFLANGVITSFAAVLVFVPQIFILFLGIGALESSGYLARAATLIDRPLSKLGLSGRSFVPLLSGFACAVPALMATRNISSKRDRLITQMIIPLMTCSARIPVYALLVGFLLPGSAWAGGLAMAALYLGALIIGALSAGVIHRFLPKDKAGFFLMELPLYRRPRVRVLLSQSWSRTKSYIQRAGPVIFTLAVLVWVGSNYPKNAQPDIQLEQSYLGQIGQQIDPLFKPMGVDWRVGIGLFSAFAAREVFVSSMALVFHSANEDEATQQQNLLQTMSAATFANGEKIFTVASVIGLLIFFMIALQCMSTFAMMKREAGSWKMAWIQLIGLNLLAYALTVLVVQGLRFFGIA